MKARSHESRESGAEVREVEVDIIKSTMIKHGISIKNSREKHKENKIRQVNFKHSISDLPLN